MGQEKRGASERDGHFYQTGQRGESLKRKAGIHRLLHRNQKRRIGCLEAVSGVQDKCQVAPQSGQEVNKE